MDVVGVALAVLAATLVVERHLPRAGLVAGGVWAIAVAILAVERALFPALAYAVAAFTMALSAAVLAAPLSPRSVRLGRGVALTLALVAAIAGAFHG